MNNFPFIFLHSGLGSVNLMVKTVKIQIEGMSGLTCATHLLRTLSAVPTVRGLGVSIGLATVEHENASVEELLDAIRAAGNYRGEIITVPAARMIARVIFRKNIDSAISPASDLPSASYLRVYSTDLKVAKRSHSSPCFPESKGYGIV